MEEMGSWPEMNEQALKRLQDTMRLFSTVLSQMEELLWVVKDVLEDLSHEDSSTRETKEGIGKPTPQRDSAVGVPSVMKEEVST